MYFNPRSPCGERLMLSASAAPNPLFQSALPLRGATLARPKPRTSRLFQSALPLRGATLYKVPNSSWIFISIRAPLAGSDNAEFEQYSSMSFQSALPLRGATATFCSITLLSAKYCSFKDRRRKFIRQIPQNSSKIRYNVVRTSLVGYERLWFATS